MKPKPISKRISAFLLCFALLVGMLPVTASAATGDFNVSGGNEGTDYSYSDGVLTINNGANLTISTSSQTRERIAVAANATATITLNNVNIKGSDGDSSNDAQSAIDIGAGASLTLILADGSDSTLAGGDRSNSRGAPGIRLPTGASLTIRGNGTLAVNGGTGDTGGTGIGGTNPSNGNGEGCGSVTIEGGTVHVNGGTGTNGHGGAGIGGGCGGFGGAGGSGGYVIISGGSVNVTGGTGNADGSAGGAGIGGGVAGAGLVAGGEGGTVTITGGSVTVTGGNGDRGGAGIGGGVSSNGSGGAGAIVTITGGGVTVTGGNVTGSGGPGGAGIGGGSGGTGGRGGTVIILVDAKVNGGTGGSTAGKAGNNIGGGQGSSSPGGNGQGIRPDSSGKYTVYGDLKLPDGVEIPSGVTVTIPNGSSLTVPDGTKLVVDGELEVETGGSLSNSGTVSGNGELTGSGTVTNNGNGSISVSDNDFAATVSLSITSGGSVVDSVTYGGSVTLTATVTGGTSEVNSGTVTFYRRDSTTGTVLNDGGAAVSNGRATASVQLNGEGWSPSSSPYTITAVYSGGTSLLGNSSTTTLTVSKAAGSIAISCSDVVYGNDVTVTVNQNTNTGADVVYSYSGTGSTSYGPSSVAPTEVGTYSVTATVAETSTHTTATSQAAMFSITQSGSALNAQPSSTSLTYGDTLKITVTLSSTELTPTNNALTPLAAGNTVELYNGDKLLTGTSEKNADGTYTLTYDTTGKGLSIGSNTLTVKFNGDTNMAASETTVTVSLNAKEVTASVDGTPSKSYDGGTAITVTLLVNNLVVSDTLTGTVSGSFADADVGTDKSITLGNQPVWTGAAAEFYSITLPTGVTGTITKATPALTLTADPMALTGGGTVTLTLTGVPESESATVTCDSGITVTAGNGNTWTATLPNTTQTYTFTASYAGSGNYNSATGTCTVEVTRRSSGGGSGSSSRPSQPTGPNTDSSKGWSGIQDEISGTRDGGTITVDMNGTTEVPAAIFEEVAGKDVDVIFQLDGDISWTVNGLDIPEAANLRDLDLGVKMGTSGIPVNVVNTVTGSVGTVQITLSHDGAFGFAMTLTAPLGRENRGLWANLYHYDEAERELVFETSAIIDKNGDVSLRFSHASQYAIIIDETSHDPETVELPFTDVPDGVWYEDAVRYVYQNGLMASTGETTFSPDGTTTRGQIVTILWRMAGSPVVNYLMDYSDVDPAAYYSEAIRWATSEGVVDGYGNGTFGPNAPITREQTAAMLYRCARHMGCDVTAHADLSWYTDAKQISGYALEALAWANAEGLLTGTSGSTMEPTGQAFRAQIAVIMMRFCQRYVEN